jgi:O-antigen/teichoic acid export membrane protein
MVPQAAAAVARLVVLVLARVAGILSMALATVTFTFVTLIPSVAYRWRRAAISRRSEPQARRDLFRYALPLAPMLMYSAVQGQLLVLIASATSGVQQLASVGALSRLAQIFSVLAVANGVVVVPRLAKMPPERRRRRVVELLTVVTIACMAISLLAWAAPGAWLALLGSHYESVRSDIGPYMCASAIGFLGSIIFGIDSACRFIYWWLSAGLIASVVATQIVCALTLDLSSVRHLIVLQTITAVVETAVASAGLAYGLRRGGRRISYGSVVG